MSKLKAVLAAYECYFDDNQDRYDEAKELVDKYQWLYKALGHNLMMCWDRYRHAWIEMDTGMGYYKCKYESIKKVVDDYGLTDLNIRSFFEDQLEGERLSWSCGPDMYEAGTLRCGASWYEMRWIFDEMKCLENGKPLKGIYFMKERAKH